MSRIEGELGHGMRLHVWTPLATEVLRYGDAEKMIHPTDLLVHIVRTSVLSSGIAWYLRNTYGHNFLPDPERVRYLARYHDDAELLTGDFPYSIKRNLSDQQRKALEDAEDKAVLKLARSFFLRESDQEIYIAAQKEVREKKTLESQIVKTADILDALGEIINEIRCGNTDFLPKVDVSRAQVAEVLTKYDFFPLVALRFGLSSHDIPPAERLRNLPTIDDNNLPDDVNSLISRESTYQWPFCYKIWLDVSRVLIPDSPEAVIFPSWQDKFKKK